MAAGRQKPLPVYALLSESGDDHAKTFRVTCTLLAAVAGDRGRGRLAPRRRAGRRGSGALQALGALTEQHAPIRGLSNAPAAFALAQPAQRTIPA